MHKQTMGHFFVDSVKLESGKTKDAVAVLNKLNKRYINRC